MDGTVAVQPQRHRRVEVARVTVPDNGTGPTLREHKPVDGPTSKAVWRALSTS